MNEPDLRVFHTNCLTCYEPSRSKALSERGCTCFTLCPEKYQNMAGPCFFDMSSVGTWVQNIFRNVVPYFWRHFPNVACHGVSISIVSISSVSCRVRILCVSVSMPCRGHPVMYCILACEAFLRVWLPGILMLCSRWQATDCCKILL